LDESAPLLSVPVFASLLINPQSTLWASRRVSYDVKEEKGELWKLA
jgi:hypothetical protein